MSYELSDMDISLLTEINIDDPSFDLTSALIKIRADIHRKKILLGSRAKLLYDLMKSVHWRIDIENVNGNMRMYIFARMNGKYVYALQQKLILITENSIKLNNHADKAIGIDIYNLGYIPAEREYIESFISDLKQLSYIDSSGRKPGFIHY